MRFDAEGIAAATGGRIIRDAGEGPVVTDTRELVAGCWFLALRGPRFDGHDFVPEALARGAVGCVVERIPESGPAGVVLVRDGVEALQDLGRAARARLHVPVVGLTGSSGKTTTRRLVALALGGLGRIHQTEANLNNHLGVPLTLLAAPETGIGAVVLEMGTSGPGEIALLADVGRPDVRLIVNVGPAHLEELGGLAGVAAEKGALFRSARPGDVLVVNLDDPWVRTIPRPPGVRIVGWGRAPEATVRLREVDVDLARFRTRVVLETPGSRVVAEIPSPGDHVARNAAAAVAVAVALDLDPAEAAGRLSAYEPVGMRMRREHLAPGVVALNDAYNANPDSMAAALAVLAAAPGRRLAVLGDMLELGVEEARWHREVVRCAGELPLALVALVGPRMAAAAEAYEGSGELLVDPDGTGVASMLRARLAPGDTVLFKGSRGARVERVLDALREPTG